MTLLVLVLALFYSHYGHHTCLAWWIIAGYVSASVDRFFWRYFTS